MPIGIAGTSVTFHEFSPFSIPGMFAYWCADNARNTGNGSNATVISDLGPNNLDLIAFEFGLTFPVYNSADPNFNHQPSITAAATQAQFDSDSVGGGTLGNDGVFPNGLVQNQPATWYSVWNHSADGSGYAQRLNYQGNVTGSFALGSNTDNSLFIGVLDSSSNFVTTGPIAAGVYVICCVYNTLNSAIYINNSQTPNAASNIDAGTFSSVGIGTFSGASGTYGWSCQVGYSGSHNSQVRFAMMRWLGIKYGISTS